MMTDLDEAGIYIAVKYNQYSTIKIKEVAENYEVPNIIPLEEFHTTIIYSKKYAENVEVYDKIQYIAIPDKLDIWTSQSGKKCLVLLLNCKQLVDRNTELTEKYQFISDYDEYKCHLTISYDIGEWNKIEEMQLYLNNNKIYNMLVTTGEYWNELVDDWSSTL